MELVNQVYMTEDYEMFKFMGGNRNINSAQLHRLEQSINEQYIQVPIIVNEKMQIIDGQHRYTVLKSLKKPIYYIQIEGLGLKEVQRLNTINKNWSMKDYMTSYCDQGMPDYIQYKDFKERYGFGYMESMMLLINKKHAPNGDAVINFKNGKFRIGSLRRAEQDATKILSLEKFYDGVRRRSFVLAYMECLQNPLFKSNRFMQKAKYQSIKFADQASKGDYLRMIEKIYNYNTKNAEAKIRLNY